MADAESTPHSAATERREVHYAGHVQGIGFRYTVRHIASEFEVAGFVRNLPDGRVQLIAEGESGELARFLAAIDETMGNYIREAKVDMRPPVGDFHTFEVRY